MSFESGNLSFRVYDLEQSLDTSVVEEFADHVAPPIDTLGAQPLSGWVSPRFILDREITVDTAVSGGYVRVDLMKAELKIPASLLKAYCRMEELAEMQQRGVPFLNRQTRAEIKKRVTDEMLPKMPPTLTAISVVLNTATSRVFTDALSETQQDAFCVNFKKTTRVSPLIVNPDSAAMSLKQIDTRELSPVCFSPDPEVTVTANNIGMDFLTWLWFFWETTNATFRLDGSKDAQPFSFMLEGPAVFLLEGEGAHETSLRKGMPLLSREAKTVLEAGKKLRKVKLTLARNQETYSATIDGLDFSFRCLKLPKPEAPAADASSALQERLAGVETFTNAFFHLYGIFLDTRKDQKTWAKTLAEMKDWISHRKTVV